MSNSGIVIFSILLIGTACSSNGKSERAEKSEVQPEKSVQQPEEEIKVPVDLKTLKIPTPKNYELIDSLCGDLDGDKIPELVVAYETPRKMEMGGNERSLCIFKLTSDKWELWKESKSALLGSEDGGMMGDPYGEMTISNGVLSIFHNGGSSWKWSYTDKYRYQENDFALIGFESVYGKPCEYWQNEDFNLSTGKFVYSKEYETCENQEQETGSAEKETFYKKDLHLTLFNRHSKEITFKTPKYKEDIYL